jgi:hypothetical protein
MIYSRTLLWTYVLIEIKAMYVGVSKSFETSSIDCQPMAVRERVHCACSRRPDRERRVMLQCSSPSDAGHSANTT